MDITLMVFLNGPFNEEEASRLEWLVSNPLGGFSSSTLSFANARKQHGMLISQQGDSRVLLVSKIEERFILGKKEFRLSSNFQPCSSRAIYPDGFSYLESFSNQPFPVFRYRMESAILEKSIFPIGKKNAFGIRYFALSHEEWGMELRPYFSIRPINYLPQGRQGYIAKSNGNCLSLSSKHGHAFISAQQSKFISSEAWQEGIFYPKDAERFTDACDCLFSPGYFVFDGNSSHELYVALADSPYKNLDLEGEFKGAIRRYRKAASGISASQSEEDPFFSDLVLAADSFVSKSGGKTRIFAGYPWFGEWGRDSMISLPGLLLCTGRYRDARDVLLRYSSFINDGLLPNFIKEDGTPSYNSADASLWFIHSSAKYARASGDRKFIKEVFLPAAKKIVNSYSSGTKNGIKVDSDGLLAAGLPGSNLTWMDVLLEDGSCPTPRWGKPVEINALWYSSLKTAEKEFLPYDREFSELCGNLALQCKKSFGKFWNSKKLCLYDVIEPHSDKTRPNQIFAVSLPHSPLEREMQEAVLKKVEAELLTPFGLRTLSPADKGYCGKYQGNMRDRDLAYHNGCVWPWLIGPFLDAKKVLGASREECLAYLLPFKSQLSVYGLGTLPEIYSGDDLVPDGCISQAWSIAEVLRKYVELKH